MQIQFDPRRAAGLIRHALMQDLAGVQQKILIVERFGNDAVPSPGIQSRLGSLHTVEEMQKKHDDLAAQIRTLTTVIDKADELNIQEFVRSMGWGK